MKSIISFTLLLFLLCFGCGLKAQQITQAEYYYDTDPGVGRGTAVDINSPSDSVTLTNQDFAIGGLSGGFHFLYMRFKYSTGIWGLTERQPFYVENGSIDTGYTYQITAAEYFFDNDPGVGNGSAIAVNSPSDSVNLLENISIGSLNPGFHHLYIRFQYSNGIWGLQDGRDFYVASPAIDTTESPAINAAEYFFDNDPGVGHGTNLPVNTPSDSVNFLANISIGSLSPGFHHLYVRLRYPDGLWGLEDGRDFYVASPAIDTTTYAINGAEYFFDNDPGVGNGHFVAIPPGSDSVNIMQAVSTVGLGLGSHNLYFRFRYTNGLWGLYQPAGSSEFTVCHPPVDTITASGPTLFCQGGSVTLTSDTAPTWTYQWQRNGVNLPDDTASTLTVTDSSGVYNVVVTDTANCPGTSDSITVIFNAQNGYSFSQTVCQGDSFSFNGQYRTQTGTYYDSLTNVNSCDSIITLYLTVANDTTWLYDSICQGNTFAFNGQNLDTSGVYTNVLTSVNGCDSVILLQLAVNPIPVVGFSLGSLVAEGLLTPYYFDTSWCVYSNNAELTLTGGIPSGGIYTGTGILSNVLYSDSFNLNLFTIDTVVYTFSLNGCSASASSDKLAIWECEGIKQLSLEQSISLFPNPAGDVLTVQSALFTTNYVTPELYDITGRLIATTDFARQKDEFIFNTTSLSAGVYFIKMNIAGSQVVRQFVKVE